MNALVSKSQVFITLSAENSRITKDAAATVYRQISQDFAQAYPNEHFANAFI